MSNRTTISAIAVIWLVSQVVAAGFARSLYGDGSFYVLFHLLTPHTFNDYDYHRSFASFITQAPLLMGQRLGVDSVAVFAALYSLGTFIFPAALFIWALYLARNQDLLFVTTAGAIVIFGFGANFINSEVNLLFALVWIAAVILSLKFPHPLLRGMVLPIVALVLIRVYEGMLLAGPVLAFWALVSFQRTDNQQEKIGLAIATMFFIVGTVIGLGGFLAPRDMGNAAGFASSAFAYLRGPQLWLLCSVASVLMVAMTARRILRFGLLSASLVFAALFVRAIVNLSGYYANSVYYYNRSFLVFLLPLVIAFLCVQYFRRPDPANAEPVKRWPAMVLIPFIAAVAGDLFGTYRWHTFLDNFCDVLASGASPESGAAMLKASGSNMGWYWTHPTLSVLLRDRASQSMVRNEVPEGWQPFDPDKAPAISSSGLCEVALWRPPRPDSLRTPISFRETTYPSYVTSVTGLSHPEGWATWSNSAIVEIRFRDDLPPSFDLLVEVAQAFGGNRGEAIFVTAGKRRESFRVLSEPYQARMSFRDVEHARAITFEIPKPESPAELGVSSDDRHLGIALVSVAIVPR